jgi:hypothetical protein
MLDILTWANELAEQLKINQAGQQNELETKMRFLAAERVNQNYPLFLSAKRVQNVAEQKQSQYDSVLNQIDKLIALAQKVEATKAAELEQPTDMKITEIAEIEEHANRFGLNVVLKDLLIDKVSFPRRRN